MSRVVHAGSLCSSVNNARFDFDGWTRCIKMYVCKVREIGTNLANEVFRKAVYASALSIARYMYAQLLSNAVTHSSSRAAGDTPPITLATYIQHPHSSPAWMRPALSPGDPTSAGKRPTLTSYMSGVNLLPGSADERSWLVPAWLPVRSFRDAASARFCHTLHVLRAQGGSLGVVQWGSGAPCGA